MSLKGKLFSSQKKTAKTAKEETFSRWQMQLEQRADLSSLKKLDQAVDDYVVWHAEFHPESPHRWRVTDVLFRMPEYAYR